ncbi:type IV toxin-antitoxin system AbiEi family antitoxin domain-containing protein [Leifsonia soli]|uniref:Very-short-patch-repair endonuclease n=1 Tax=Leifsonia soli TaxID=582665 RepID=A0A852SVE4_9MICO|nr:type IV toxin-antitoxin system AbiEi family antitoxin domain-containing protein [Leifsonia soli]NYD72594.1 very-short-patch-repair endonuclease [Leifsonia soli]
MEWMTELVRLGGAASIGQLRAAGVRERALSAAVRDGRLVRPRSGRYALPGVGDPTLTALRAGGRLSCVSAARTYGLWGGHDERTHLLVPSHAGRAGAADGRTVRHWGRAERHGEVWRVSLADCLRSSVRCADDETAAAVLDTAISSGQATRNGLRRMFADEPKRSRRLIELARPGSDSGVESLVRQRLTARGHIVEQQLAVAGVGRVDARVDGVLYLEIDGFEFHADRASFERDRRRDIAMALRGLPRVRLSARQVLRSPDAMVATIEELLGSLEREGFRRASAA